MTRLRDVLTLDQIRRIGDALENARDDAAEACHLDIQLVRVNIFDFDGAVKSHIDANLRPYTWYRRHVVEGATHFRLDPEYVAKIAAMEAIADPRPGRARQQLRYPCDHDVDPADWADLDCDDSLLQPCE